MKILIAGGTGSIGTVLSEYLAKQGHEVLILTRNPNAHNHIFWDPAMGKWDKDRLNDTEVLINLAGEGIGNKRWSKKRKTTLESSRIEPINFLYKHIDDLPHLKQFISASGITCYGFKDKKECYSEKDPYGDTYIDQLCEKWENAAQQLSGIVPVTILRFAVVLSEQGGAIEKMIKPIRTGIGAPIGTGDQVIPWIHINDLTAFILFSIENQLEGTYNLLAGNTTNAILTKAIAKRVGKKLWMPKVPGIIIKILFGELSQLLLQGVCVKNNKVMDTGFKFHYTELNQAISSLQI